MPHLRYNSGIDYEALGFTDGLTDGLGLVGVALCVGLGLVGVALCVGLGLAVGRGELVADGATDGVCVALALGFIDVVLLGVTLAHAASRSKSAAKTARIDFFIWLTS